MAEYCKECSIAAHGKDTKDLAAITTKAESERGLFKVAVCEGCGVIQVDYDGACISEDCTKSHIHGHTKEIVITKSGKLSLLEFLLSKIS